MAETRSRRHMDAQPVNPIQMAMGRAPGHGLATAERPKQTGPVVRRVWGYLAHQRAGLLTVFICTAVSTGLSLFGPYLIGKSVDKYIIPRDYHGFLQICVVLLAIYVSGTCIGWVQQYMMVGVTQNTVRQMRQDLFVKFQNLPIRYFDTRTHGELMSRTTNDISNVSNTLNQSVTQLLSSVFMLVGSLVMMLILSPWMTLVTTTTIPIITFAARRITKYTRKYFADQQRHLGEINGFVEETISGQRVVQVFHREERVLQEFRVINDRLRKVGIKAQSLSGSMGPLMNATSNLTFAIIAIAGGWMAFRNVVTIGIVVSFLNYSRLFSQPVNQLANQYNMVQSAIAGAERVFDVLDADSEYHALTESASLERICGEVVFDRVDFGYSRDVPVLKDISFVAKPGDTIALVGPTGAGKTTIVNLLTRFYDIDSGEITIDGVNIRTFDKHWLRNQLGLVLQDAYLFSDTIRENIRYGRLDATDAEVEEAATLANADGFIRKLPHGYDALLTAEGRNLSQGQRQLITIARAILANPAILILDEATSNVDTRTEVHIQEAMHRLMRGRTSFVIAHRLSTIRDADVILVIDHGQIMERGSHAELLEHKGIYYELYTSQFSGVG